MDQWALVVQWDQVARWVLDQMDLWALEVQEALEDPEDLEVLVALEDLVVLGDQVVQEDPWDQTHPWVGQAQGDHQMK